ncbi:NTF2 fold immunity protein [Bradyrhizobium sp. HKCCYLS2058]|uniref:NTF2 fold immunity protein n=1 Tax=unclassified Bradyrhizobium TaxID=2631580 RepID=UPI003EC0690B
MKAGTTRLIAAALMLNISSLSAQTTFFPPKEFVADADTAIAIARAVLIPIYGAEAIQREEPLTARRQGGTWIVEGTLCGGAPNCLGGVAELHLSAQDGRIIYVIHGQ